MSEPRAIYSAALDDRAGDEEAERRYQEQQTKERERKDARAPVGSREWGRGLLSCRATGCDSGEDVR